MSRTSEIERLFHRDPFGKNELIVQITDPEHFLSEIEDVRSWAIHDINALTKLLSLATDEDGGCSPSETLINDCMYALSHITDLLKTLESMECEARGQIREANHDS